MPHRMPLAWTLILTLLVTGSALAEYRERAAEFRERVRQSLQERVARPQTLPHPLTAYAGSYVNPTYGQMEWRVVDGRLEATMGIMQSAATGSRRPDTGVEPGAADDDGAIARCRLNQKQHHEEEGRVRAAAHIWLDSTNGCRVPDGGELSVDENVTVAARRRQVAQSAADRPDNGDQRVLDDGHPLEETVLGEAIQIDPLCHGDPLQRFADTREVDAHVEQSEAQLPEDGILDLGRQGLEMLSVIGGDDDRRLNPHLIGRALCLSHQ